MSLITIRVIDGADRGRMFAEAPTPLTIGREEGNSIQLNDERISRFHLKIQKDDEKVVLTDLQSTNGTRVNGESVQIWTLRPGDVISLGRTTLLFGSRDEIAARLAILRGVDLSEGVLPEATDPDHATESLSLEAELDWSPEPGARSLLHTLLPPELPHKLNPGQTAELSELLHYLHIRLRTLIDAVQVKPKSQRVTLEQRHWQNLLDLQDRLANYLRAIGEPEE